MLDALLCSVSHYFALGEYMKAMECGDQIFQLYDMNKHFNYIPHSIYNIATATKVLYACSLAAIGNVAEGLEYSKSALYFRQLLYLP